MMKIVMITMEDDDGYDNGDAEDTDDHEDDSGG